jgi:tRNA pseudouridine55 synthase
LDRSDLSNLEKSWIVDGILNLNKPRGWTSHDVVAHVRRLTGIRRVGHAGTLDPMATGVLLLCLGQATRIAEYLMAGRKRYQAVVRLGVRTDTHDADGQVTGTAPVVVSRAQLEDALSHFRGSIEQVPPMVSALKREGQPLYRLARRGITVARPARPIEIHELHLTAWLPPDLTLDLACSPGTYVRALARDLGERLGCGAHLTALTRLACGGFRLSEAIDLDRFTATVTGRDQDQSEVPEGWHRWVAPLDAGLQHLPALDLDVEESRQVRSGRSLLLARASAAGGGLCRAYALSDTGKRLLALLRFDDQSGLWRPHKVFYPL